MAEALEGTRIDQLESSKKSTPEDLQFYPRDYWGLNYYFRIFNKMYICDIVNMSEYPLFPGAFCYKNHPIYKVDIVGVVVKRIERQKCFIYGIDDGTAVISCCCWRNDMTENTSYDDGNLPDILRRKSRETTETNQSDGYLLGDFIQVRGKIKTYLGQKEIIAAYHNKIDNPMFEVARMAELPKLYKQNYDKPFKLPRKVAQEIEISKQEEVTGVKSQKRVIKELREALLVHFEKIQMSELSALDLLELDTVKQILVQVDLCNGENVTVDNVGIIKQTLHSLEEDGFVCKKSGSSDDVYEILSKHTMLEGVIKKILIASSSKPKYYEKGCHYFHVLDELHKTSQYSKVNKNCILYCLNKLETQSDIIRTTPYHYLAYNT